MKMMKVNLCYEIFKDVKIFFIYLLVSLIQTYSWSFNYNTILESCNLYIC